MPDIASMDFVALLSGGKDSCYNIYQCQKYGHCLVCVANLHPPVESDELNSFMYQCAGASAIPAIAECLGVPLIRREIHGKAKDMSLEYDQRSCEDEVEDLYELLVDVLQRYPTVKGVSCGAIISSYQRFRVENICQRLGLTMLAYLWQRDRPQLIREIVSAGFDVVLVKVAGAGLDPHKHLGKHVADLLPTLQRLHEKYGLDMCGEGGEYESFVLDGPIFHKRIVLGDTECVLDEEDPSVGNLVIRSWQIVDKPEPLPAMPLDLLAEEVYAQSRLLLMDVPIVAPKERQRPGVPLLTLSLSVDNTGLGQSPLLLPSPSHSSGDISAAVHCQLAEMIATLSLSLQRIGCVLEDITFVHLYLADMSLFAAANEAYGKHFPSRNPPSRSCLQASLPAGKLLAMDVSFLRGSYAAMASGNANLRHIRQVLHVRSLSSWAPQCIGPYSQANMLHDCLLQVAGQIPLLPSTMQLLPDAPSSGALALDGRHRLAANLQLCMRNVEAILSAQMCSLNSLLSCVVFVNTANLTDAQADEMCEQLQPMVLAAIRRQRSVKPAAVATEEDEEDLAESSDEEEEQAPSDPAVLVVGVSDLPRHAPLEVEVTAVKDGILVPSNTWQCFHQTGVAVSSASRDVPFTSMPLDSWPLWNNPSKPPVDAAPARCRAMVSMKCFPTCIAAGTISVLAEEQTDSMVLSELVDVLMTNAVQMLTSARMPLSAWRSLRIFLPHALGQGMEAEAVRGECMQYLALHHPDSCIPGIVSVSVSALPSADGSACLLQAQLLAVDLQQIETERWIAQT